MQFGESPFFSRSADDKDFVTQHEVLPRELDPNRTYYYRVSSFDRAGNLSINTVTNTFTTLRRDPAALDR